MLAALLLGDVLPRAQHVGDARDARGERLLPARGPLAGLHRRVQAAFHELPQRFQTRDGGFAQFLDALPHPPEIGGAGRKARMGLGIYGPLRPDDA